MGTTPPSNENAGDHPSGLRSQRSYPGISQTTQTSTTSNTVPPSPTAVQVREFHIIIYFENFYFLVFFLTKL